ncbi:MAG: Aminopeptidase, partial [Verrucomicrobiales bacterium]|nr:Aminopeptidase [Verrucomicrobiales bacterium]
MFSQINKPTKLVGVILLISFAATGCIRIPSAHPAAGISSTELASHVNFLAQPALKGRKPGTHGSRIARNYIVDRFKSYGLVPWGREKDYVQSFGYGNNIIGVLQGSDTNLSSEFVLVSAHYDHLGKDHGKLCLGAADNASGVAGLLEMAKQMSLYEQRPKRSVVFAAFDSEEMMLLGSFVFSCRPDVEKARIVAVLNMDILGRDFMDVVQNTLFVTGTEQYPALREQIFRSGTNAGVDVRPVGTDLIGPRGDHVAFEQRPIPCMFFSSGMYGDYHKPTDTPEKLNYTAI